MLKSTPSQRDLVVTQTSVSLSFVWFFSEFAFICMLLVGMRLPAPHAFYFSPRTDSFFENPANWQPYYPGPHIRKKHEIHIQGMCYLTSFNLTLAGKLYVEKDATLYAFAGGLLVEPKAQIHNQGEIIINQLYHKGKLFNMPGAHFDVLNFYSYSSSITQNFSHAQFNIVGTCDNEGSFMNYGLCVVKEAIAYPENFSQGDGANLLTDLVQVDSLYLTSLLNL